MSIKSVLAVTLAASTIALSLPGVADAKHRHHHRHRNAEAAIIGFGVGALFGGVVTHRHRNYYDAPVRYRYGPRPWTREWHYRCGIKYRSFNHRTGYYFGFDGRHHFCRLP
jgi:hypothetical protein